MTVALMLSGWLCALLGGWRVLVLGRRLELVASAEHELRGPLAALTLATARSRPLPPTLVEGQLERARVALADLTEARRGRRAVARARRHELGSVAERAAAAWDVRVDWRAGHAPVDADPARVSQALGNCRQAYGVDLPLCRDRDHDGFPDALERRRVTSDE